MKKLNVSTQNAISSLEWVLAHHRELPQTDDEFDSTQFSNELGIGYDSARCKLSRMVKNGLLDHRKITKNGTRINLYSRKLPLN